MIMQIHTVNTTIETNIIIDEYSLEQTIPDASISGNIYWQFGEYFFPEEHWYDYVSTLLSWWSEAFREILRGSDFKKELMFMDGPQLMFVESYDSSSFHITCHQREKYLVTYSFIVNKKKLIRSFVLKMTRLLAWCKQYNLSCDDMRTIEYNATMFKKWLKTNFSN
jgi:hypothetical protein